jgi:hypothetical protein
VLIPMSNLKNSRPPQSKGFVDTYLCRQVGIAEGKTGWFKVDLQKPGGGEISLLVRNPTPYRVGARYKVQVEEDK